MTIGEKIKRLRKEQGKTQEELGAAIGVQKAAINKYETGIVVNIKRATIEKLAHEFRVSPVWLMDDDDGWPPIRTASGIMERARRIREGQENEDEFDTGSPKTVEAQILAKGVDMLPQEQREQALAVVRAMFVKYAEYFNNMEDKDET